MPQTEVAAQRELALRVRPRKAALNLNPAVQTTEHTKYTEVEMAASVQAITQ